MNTIGENIRTLREAKGLGQRALARAAQIDSGALSRLEGGKVADPGMTMLQQLAGGLGVSVGQLLGETTSANGSGGLPKLPLDAVAPSPLNPRKTFNEPEMQELAESIVAQGVLEPIIVRPDPKAPGRYEIAAGERRWRAARVAGFTEIPAIVRELRDADLLEIAIVENQQRRDVPPLEEGEGYCALAALDPKRYTPKAIADRIGRTDRYVQKRMKLARELAPGAKKLLADGTINVHQAQVLTTVAPNRQKAVLKDIERGWIRTGEQLRQAVFGGMHELDWAIFPLEAYKGEIVEDPENAERRFFADTALAEKLQHDAIAALEAKLKEKWAWVKVSPPTEYFHDWEYRKSKDRKKAGAVIDVSGRLSVTVREGLVKPAPTKATGGKSASAEGDEPAAKESAPFTNTHLAYAANRKTEALQAAIAGDPRTAMILACMAVMGARGNVHIDAIRHERDDQVLHPQLAATADAFADVLKGARRNAPDDARGPLRIGGASMYELPRPRDELKLYMALRAMAQPDLERLLALLVAARCGTFNGYRPQLGDSPLAVQLAQDLDVKVSDHWKADDDEYLKRARKPRLIEILAAATGEDPAGLEKSTSGQLRKRIKAEAAHVVPREMLFGSEGDLAKAKPLVPDPAETPDGEQ